MKEVDLCGHATLAAAHVLITEGLVDTCKPIVFESRVSGELIATVLESGRIQLSFPSTPPSAKQYSAPELDALKTAFGLTDADILFVGGSIYDAFFEVTPEAFAKIEAIVDYTSIAKIDCPRGVLITAAGGKRQSTDERFKDYDVTSRCFFPR